ncbi:3-oxoacyl-[acyl-carrier-protein] reductase [soil metagenome]
MIDAAHVDTDPSSDPWSGKTALVTGSTRGLGRTTAEHLAQRGTDLVVSGRIQLDVEKAVFELSGAGVKVIGIAADLSKTSEAHRLAESAIASVGKLDILVNNAGMSIRGDFWNVSDKEWENQVNVNIRSPFILAQYAARNMIALQTKGRIVNVGTIGARRCHTNACVYDMAKGGVEVMTRNMAYELGPHGIGVNCVVPGAIPIRPGSSFDSEANQSYLSHVPFGRFGEADDIAAAVIFFCNPRTEFTTGQSLLVDGGHATWLPVL